MLSLGAGCSVERAADGDGESTELVGAEEDDGTDGRGAESVVGTVAVGQTLKTNAALNLRSSASTSAKILLVIPKGSKVTVVSATPKSGWYNIKFAGTTGWSFGVYLDPTSSSGGSSGGSGGSGGGSGGSPDSTDFITRAKAGVGFSYWWGHGRWSMAGPGGSTPAGSCSGSCPSCSHSGSYGADCSGYVGKIWRVPSSNSDVTVDQHPYSTGNFVADTSLWRTVSRAAASRRATRSSTTRAAPVTSSSTRAATAGARCGRTRPRAARTASSTTSAPRAAPTRPSARTEARRERAVWSGVAVRAILSACASPRPRSCA